MEVRKGPVGQGSCKQKTKFRCLSFARSTVLCDTTPKAGQSGCAHAGALGSSRPSWINRSAGAKQANKSWHSLAYPDPLLPLPFQLTRVSIASKWAQVSFDLSPLPFIRDNCIYRMDELSPICDLPAGFLSGICQLHISAANGKNKRQADMGCLRIVRLTYG